MLSQMSIPPLNEMCKPFAVLKLFFRIRFLEFVHDVHDMDEVLKSL
jgi:hypothetical protein